MLVLSRRQDDKIIVGQNVTITILKIRGNTVRIGIDAPREVDVVRGELNDRKKTIETSSESGTGVTVEFRSNGQEPGESGPSLRVVTDQMPTCESATEKLAGPGLHHHVARLDPMLAREQPQE